ncbi:pseudoazurin [Diaphorobacter sp. HDW4A]|mgnify:CR=1 FL=1|uniref:pseudoazurin n=1 Tax=Betaproteobacteria TaxID=28216 RepID=UPI0014082DBC|nr:MULTISPECIES: pseudoazurin [Betaproteobacteria]MCK6375786.1 pseudoazurin [Zoogloea sp.]MCK6394946.1 pseudoazurin [Zoogloea sp.]QIL78943.1 pseudoazurin [Diaphorobacter sp. HDW4A]
MFLAVSHRSSVAHRPSTFLGALLLLAAMSSAQASDHTVKMLSSGKDGAMVFEPAFVKVAVGDTVIFTPTEKAAHNSASLLVPAGATGWKSDPDKEFKVKIEKEGVYLYACQPHKMMGMVGVIQAGKPVNLADAKAAAAKEQATFAMGKDRFDKALAQAK